jgi:SAM-dependent methyltransferase
MSTAHQALSAELKMTPLSRCRGCHAPAAALDEILGLDPMPLVGHFAASADEARGLPRYPFTLVFCTVCGLVQVLEDVDPYVLFGSYHYQSSSIPGVVRHFGGYAGELAQRYGLGPVAVLEVGCNDGVLLRQLPAGWRRVGVDPSDVAARAADGTYELVNEHFGSAIAAETAADGQFDLVVSSNCIAHVSDIGDVLLGMSAVLREGGDLWIEAHDLDAVLSGQWDALYHEHKAYWSADALARCTRPFGFELQEVFRLPTHGGLLRVRLRRVKTAGKGDDRPDRPSFERVLAAYRGRRSTATYRGLERAFASQQPVAAYGASGRAAVWFNQLPELQFGYVVDDSPLRAHTWIAGVALPVVDASAFRSRPPAVCVITAWNYADDIKLRHPWFAGSWLQSFSRQ